MMIFISYNFPSQVNDLTPEVVKAARIVLQKPDNPASQEHFELLKKQWQDHMEMLRSLVDDATDTEAFIKACGQSIYKQQFSVLSMKLGE